MYIKTIKHNDEIDLRTSTGLDADYNNEVASRLSVIDALKTSSDKETAKHYEWFKVCHMKTYSEMYPKEVHTSKELKSIKKLDNISIKINELSKNPKKNLEKMKPLLRKAYLLLTGREYPIWP